MNNTFGRNLALTLYGESHGPEIGCILDGLEPGLPVDEAHVARLLEKRRPSGLLGTARREPDPFEIVSGVLNGRTTGAPLCIRIPNRAARPEDYAAAADKPRPSHADYTARVKYRGFADLRGGGHFSGRLTAAVAAAGAILLDALALRGIRVGTHLARCGGIADRPFADDPAQDLSALEAAPFPVLDPERGEAMQAAVLAARASGDSLGGVLETAVTGLPAGLGEPWFDTLEGLLAHALFSVPAVKGVEFGGGFALAELRGSAANDPFRMEQGRVVTASNHSGGIQGGISNGMPLTVRAAYKPTPSIALPQRTVDLASGTDTVLELCGRHDPCLALRACPVQDSLVALVLLDLLTGRRP